jgi:hypothetical protein
VKFRATVCEMRNGRRGAELAYAKNIMHCTMFRNFLGSR